MKKIRFILKILNLKPRIRRIYIMQVNHIISSPLSLSLKNQFCTHKEGKFGGGGYTSGNKFLKIFKITTIRNTDQSIQLKKIGRTSQTHSTCMWMPCCIRRCSYASPCCTDLDQNCASCTKCIRFFFVIFWGFVLQKIRVFGTYAYI